MLATDVFVQFNKFFYLYSINLKKKLQILSQQTKFTICMIVFYNSIKKTATHKNKA